MRATKVVFTGKGKTSVSSISRPASMADWVICRLRYPVFEDLWAALHMSVEMPAGAPALLRPICVTANLVVLVVNRDPPKGSAHRGLRPPASLPDWQFLWSGTPGNRPWRTSRCNRIRQRCRRFPFQTQAFSAGVGEECCRSSGCPCRCKHKKLECIVYI